MSTSQEQKADILRYWESIEYFTPQALPDLAPRHEAFPVYRVAQGGHMPWMQGHPHQKRRLRPSYGWRYTAFLNSISVNAIRESLEALLGTSESKTARDERADQSSALFTVAIDRHGSLIPDSLVCASIGWAYTTLIQQGGQQRFSLDDFEQYQKDALYLFNERYAGQYASPETLAQLSKDLGEALVLPDTAILGDGLRVSAFSMKLDQEELSREQARQQRGTGADNRQEEGDDQTVPPENLPTDMLNSFFLGELSRIARCVDQGVSSPPLNAYLGDSPASQQDVRQSISLSWNALKPEFFPPARWPGKGRYPLVYSQQVAVNLMFHQLAKGSGLQAVNGPPGTGKTTLLKDVVAAIITQRAEALSAFRRPQMAFQGKSTAFRTEKFTQQYHALDSSLSGYGMVVASANNGAVENVVEEFPSAEDVDPLRAKRQSVFTDLASELLGREAWSLLSVKLGNKSNRNLFLSKFWFDTQQATSIEGDSAEAPLPGARSRIKDARLNDHDWWQVVAKFKKALIEEQTLRKERDALHEGLVRQRKLASQLQGLESNAEEAGLRLDSARKSADSARAAHLTALNRFTVAESKFKMLPYEKPGAFWLLLHRFFKLDRVRQWVATQREVMQDYESTLQALEEAKATYLTEKDSFEKAVTGVTQAQKQLESEKKAHRKLVNSLQRYQRQHPNAHPDLSRLSSDIRYRETSAPLADEVSLSIIVATKQ